MQDLLSVERTRNPLLMPEAILLPHPSPLPHLGLPLTPLVRQASRIAAVPH